MVIMIDDDEDALEIYQLLIEGTPGAEHFHTFNSGHSAFVFLTQCVQEGTTFPAYILLDLNMPDIDGIEFIEHYESLYAESYPDTEIYVLTSSVREKDNEKALSYRPVREFISKPLHKEKLIALIEKSLPG